MFHTAETPADVPAINVEYNTVLNVPMSFTTKKLLIVIELKKACANVLQALTKISLTFSLFSFFKALTPFAIKK